MPGGFGQSDIAAVSGQTKWFFSPRTLKKRTLKSNNNKNCSPFQPCQGCWLRHSTGMITKHFVPFGQYTLKYVNTGSRPRYKSRL